MLNFPFWQVYFTVYEQARLDIIGAHFAIVEAEIGKIGVLIVADDVGAEGAEEGAVGDDENSCVRIVPSAELVEELSGALQKVTDGLDAVFIRIKFYIIYVYLQGARIDGLLFQLTEAALHDQWFRNQGD